MEYRRNFEAGGTYFFTVVTQSRQPILIDNIDLLRAAFVHTRKRYPFEIDAVVVLPDHLHTIWNLPRGDDDYARRWMVLKRKFSSPLSSATLNRSQRRKREKGVWQRRYWEHTIRDERDWRHHLDYIHYNPVKHGYVQAPRDWPYSSFMRAVGDGLYEPDWGMEIPAGVADVEYE
ncbi:transposase [Solemya pervernicosa gill symbiont]|uniref:Transposase n=2 Tax=Gammaproteobacteria incertae sedis TaxID=118884 RepID=A0A1T2L2T0_9GAMM|nr:transposase [Candidatus Reidiella endopervernicosa]OOZ39330.1 transposase [Solemya pervernicosa gill symbiont]QKQ25528.1 transposase [Candidatus Reidiella endopervernicosa]